jgi:hypothetical protein
MFDWRIKNGDRTQTDVGGNPNLFWDVDNDSLLVLDHNQAFDPDFAPRCLKNFIRSVRTWTIFFHKW